MPVEQVLVDGVVRIHGGRGIILIRLVQGIDKEVQFPVRQIADPLAHGLDLIRMAQGHQNLVLGVMAVEVQRANKTQVNALVHKIQVVQVVLQDIANFPAQGWILLNRSHITVQIAIIMRILGTGGSPDGVLEHLQQQAALCPLGGPFHSSLRGKLREESLNPSSGINGTDLS